MTAIFTGQSLNEILTTMKKSGVETKPILVCGKTDGEWKVRPANYSSRMVIHCDDRIHISA